MLERPPALGATLKPAMGVVVRNLYCHDPR
jgi:hypothetical protein